MRPFILAVCLALSACAHQQVRDDTPGSGGGISLSTSAVAQAALAQGMGMGGLRSINGGPREHVSQDMLAKSLTLSAASGANAVGISTNGARVDFGAGASDHCISNGTFIICGPLASTGYVNSGGTSQGLLFSGTATNLYANTGGILSLGDATNTTTAQTSDNYFRFSISGAGAPTAGDCNADAERGRLYIDTTNNLLYVCNGSVRLWDSVALTD